MLQHTPVVIIAPRRAVVRSLAAAGLAATLVVTALGTPGQAADVDRSPIAYLSGQANELSRPQSIDLDASGRMVVADLDTGVKVFARDAVGNAAPVQSIDGPATTLVGPRTAVVGPDGEIYVGDLFGAGTNKVAVFDADATGDVAPLRVISGNNTGISWAQGLAFDAAGRLYVANREADSVTVYAPGASGNVVPLRTIAGAATGLAAPVGIAVEADGTVHVSNLDAARITTFAPGATGNATPVRTIEGAATQLDVVLDVELDSRRNLYVTDLGATPAVLVFARGATGNVPPLVRLAGGQTDLAGPTGVAVDARHVVRVTNTATETVTTYAPLVPTTPLAARSVKVSGKASAARRTVSWKAPTDTGGAPVSYVVTVKKGTKTLVTKRVTSTKVILQKKKLRTGKHIVTVVARNVAGPGPAAKTTFTVSR